MTQTWAGCFVPVVYERDEGKCRGGMPKIADSVGEWIGLSDAHLKFRVLD